MANSQNLLSEIQITWMEGKTKTTGRAITLWDSLTGKCLRATDRAIIDRMRELDPSDPDYSKKMRELKQRLPVVTPAADIKSRKTGKVEIESYSGIMQIDIDSKVCNNYDIEELKKEFFKLPFVAYAGRSCSGRGIFILMRIAEPEKLKDYFAHVADLLETVGIEIDRSNGYDYHHLRYVSFDPNGLINPDFVPLKIKRFKRKNFGLKKVVSHRAYADNINLALPLIEAIEAKQLDFVPEYPEYVEIAFALSEGTGEKGRELFHRCCQFSPKYEKGHADYQYDLAVKNLRTGTNAITFGTFIHRCKEFGLDSYAAFKNI